MANVSVATASRALSNPDLVAESTRKLVRAAADACGYQINLVARSLRIQRTDTILALLPEIDDRFYPAIVKGMEESAHAAGYSMILGLSRIHPERGSFYRDIVNSRRVDGLVVIDFDLGRIAGNKAELNVPVVTVLESVADDAIPSVRVDELQIAELAVRHLASLGHRRIAHISGGQHSRGARQRTTGFQQAAAANGCDCDPDLVVQGNFLFDGGADAMETILNRPRPPSAVFCANDTSAMGAMTACRRRGVEIPRDLSLVGVDDIDEAGHLVPPLTTVRQPRHGIGAAAVNLLIAQIEGANIIDRDIVMPVELVMRGSTAPPLHPR